MSATLIDVPPGHIASVVTTLEMTRRPRPRPLPLVGALQLVAVPAPDPEWYRALFHTVGGPWLWFSRLAMDNATLRGHIHDPAVSVFAVRRFSTDVGLLELDFRVAGACELAFMGLVPPLTGKGFGDWLMAAAITHAWAQPISRLWVHTCTLDHPRALGFYQRHGFVPIRRQVEIAADPRLNGLLDPRLGAHTPRIGELDT